MSDNTQQIEELKATVQQLQQDLESLKKHNHLGVDDSIEFQGETNFKGRSITISGAVTQGNKIVLPIVVTDGIGKDWLKPGGGQRLAASGLSVINDKGSAAEQDSQTLGVSKPGKAFETDQILPNQTDWDDSAQAIFRLILNPQGVAAFSGPSVFPPLGFVAAERTPTVQGSTGTLVNGGSTLTDSTANFTPGALVGSIISILSAAGSPLESYIVLDNTSNVITAGTFKSDGTAVEALWSVPSGTHPYSVRSTVLLGESGMPFARAYIGEDIRLGYGSSGGSQVRYIKWGYGSPEGVVTANIGSMYLRFDGGAGSTLYIKQANNGLATGWAAK